MLLIVGGFGPRHHKQFALQALAGGGSGSLAGGKGDGWSGGGGDGSDGQGGAGDESGDASRKANWAWQGWKDRVACDPEFPFKVLLEQVSLPSSMQLLHPVWVHSVYFSTPHPPLGAASNKICQYGVMPWHHSKSHLSHTGLCR